MFSYKALVVNDQQDEDKMLHSGSSQCSFLQQQKCAEMLKLERESLHLL